MTEGAIYQYHYYMSNMSHLDTFHHCSTLIISAFRFLLISLLLISIFTINRLILVRYRCVSLKPYTKCWYNKWYYLNWESINFKVCSAWMKYLMKNFRNIEIYFFVTYWTLGETPYSGLSEDEIEKQIRLGVSLSQPMCCPGAM